LACSALVDDHGQGGALRAHAVAPSHFATEGDAYRFGIAPLKIEVLTKISGVSFDEALRDAKAFELDGYAISYIGKPALIANNNGLCQAPSR